MCISHPGHGRLCKKTKATRLLLRGKNASKKKRNESSCLRFYHLKICAWATLCICFVFVLLEFIVSSTLCHILLNCHSRRPHSHRDVQHTVVCLALVYGVNIWYYIILFRLFDSPLHLFFVIRVVAAATLEISPLKNSYRITRGNAEFGARHIWAFIQWILVEKCEKCHCFFPLLVLVTKIIYAAKRSKTCDIYMSYNLAV